jgi:hypothetical protein
MRIGLDNTSVITSSGFCFRGDERPSYWPPTVSCLERIGEVLSGGKKPVSKDLYAFTKPCSRPIGLLVHPSHLQPTPKLHMAIKTLRFSKEEQQNMAPACDSFGVMEACGRLVAVSCDLKKSFRVQRMMDE